jgi:hypothetical protein
LNFVLWLLLLLSRAVCQIQYDLLTGVSFTIFFR